MIVFIGAICLLFPFYLKNNDKLNGKELLLVDVDSKKHYLQGTNPYHFLGVWDLEFFYLIDMELYCEEV